MQKVLSFGVLLLEGQDGQTWKDHACNCALCHLLYVDGHIDTSLVLVHVGLFCMLRERFIGVVTMLVCDRCSRGWYREVLHCLWTRH